MTKQCREQLKEHLKLEEGLSLKAYKCPTGHTTIGYGHCDDSMPLNTTCTLEEAEQWLKSDINRSVAAVMDLLSAYAWYRLTDSQKIALVSMAFQLGGQGLKGFKRMWRAIYQNQWHLAQREALDSLWAQQTPSRAKRITDMFVE